MNSPVFSSLDDIYCSLKELQEDPTVYSLDPLQFPFSSQFPLHLQLLGRSNFARRQKWNVAMFTSGHQSSL